MIRPDDYLAISEEYCRALGGLRWCSDAEAVEYRCNDPEIGITFAMAAEIALFLEGFHTSGRPIAFAFILHLLHLLARGVRNPRAEMRPPASELEHAFRELNSPFRNAGVFCGVLCRDIPAVPDAPEPSELLLTLRHPHSLPDSPRRGQLQGKVPPLEPAEFEQRFFRALGRFSLPEIRHWLRFGRGRVDEGGEELTRALPRTLSGCLTSVIARPRLTGAGPLVSHLAGSLTLPPRQLAPGRLSTGGYSDVATRGLPEQILPTQLAIDGEEFVRRFTQRELLYFRREQPRSPIADEIVVLLDQGVRTWGEVRLLLGAAVVALARQAERRGIPFLIATTGRQGTLFNPLQLGEAQLGSLIEASDLTEHPADALKLVLEQPAGSDIRDVILLTHHRNLAESEVQTNARLLRPGTRLFAASVDGKGHVEFSEILRGTAVVRSRCRVDLARTREVRVAPSLAGSTPPRAWEGDVESPGWPFTLGALSPIPSNGFDFDSTGEWITFSGLRGILHAWRADGSKMEMLPRAIVEGRPLTRIDAVLGVSGGFVVAAREGPLSVLAHYDFSSRHCVVYPLGPAPPETNKAWTYQEQFHTVVGADEGTAISIVVLGDDSHDHQGLPGVSRRSLTHRQRRALAESLLDSDRNREIVVLESETGALVLRDSSGQSHTIVPLRNGQPALKGGRIQLVRSGGDIVAAAVATPQSSSLYLLSTASFTVVGVWPLRVEDPSFALSRDGRRFARKVGERHLEVRTIPSGPTPLLFTPQGKTHNGGVLELGNGFLTIQAAQHFHMILWEQGRLEFVRPSGGRDDPKVRQRLSSPDGNLRFRCSEPLQDPAARESNRFTASCHFEGLTAQIDFLGHVSIFGPSSRLICMFYMFREKIAAWMPDGTRVGPVSLIGGSPTPDGEEKIGRALHEASRSRWSP